MGHRGRLIESGSAAPINLTVNSPSVPEVLRLPCASCHSCGCSEWFLVLAREYLVESELRANAIKAPGRPTPAYVRGPGNDSCVGRSFLSGGDDILDDVLHGLVEGREASEAT